MSRTKKIIWGILGSPIGLTLVVRPVWNFWTFIYWLKRPLELDLPHKLLLFRPEIRDDKKVLSVHLDNQKFLQLQKSGIKPIELSKLAHEDLRVALVSPKTAEFEYFYFRSVHRRLMKDWGMEIHELPNGLGLIFEQFYAEGFILIYHPNGTSRTFEGLPKMADGRIYRKH